METFVVLGIIGVAVVILWKTRVIEKIKKRFSKKRIVF